MVAAKIFALAFAGLVAAAPPVSVFTDGQPQATVAASKVPVSVFTDGQPQATVAPTKAANATVVSPTPTIVAAGAANLFVNGGVMVAAVGLAAAALL